MFWKQFARFYLARDVFGLENIRYVRLFFLQSDFQRNERDYARGQRIHCAKAAGGADFGILQPCLPRAVDYQMGEFAQSLSLHARPLLLPRILTRLSSLGATSAIVESRGPPSLNALLAAPSAGEDAPRVMELFEVIRGLKWAQRDERIKGIFADFSSLHVPASVAPEPLGLAQIEELVQAIVSATLLAQLIFYSYVRARMRLPPSPARVQNREA